MTLIEAFEKWAVEGVPGHPDKVVETLLSKLFFFGDKVYKVYKKEENSISKLDRAGRIEFYRQDFYWNNRMSPEIYIKLQPLKENNGLFLNTSFEEADDFYILMNKIDDSQNLTTLLGKGGMQDEQIRKVVREMGNRLKAISRENGEEIEDILQTGWREFNNRNIEALEWIYEASPALPFETSRRVISFLQDIVDKEEYFSFKRCPRPSAAIDNQSDNILLLNDNVCFIDIYPPKKIWRARDDLFVLARLATDVAVLGNKEMSEMVYDEYRNIAPAWPSQVTDIYEIESALIKTAYYFIIKKAGLAERYLSFIESHPLYLRKKHETQ
ncbi:hypothetical protein C4572_01285 [Candidatus Parcubacteria bacterium]|nr:MAG: hypothetical protein C4572_01285 [Candidatus Parcubacteria bacterium]